MILNHLWQSTWFALGAALLSLAFRTNRAQVRYWLWFGASLKFLIPFSLLVSIGNQIEWRAAPAIAQPRMILAVVDEISQPFTSVAPVPLMARVPQTPSRIPILLFSVWICGFGACISVWSLRWRRLRRAVRRATPVRVNIRSDFPIPVMSSPERLEPGVFGILCPVLLLPEGIVNLLSSAHLQMILAHELCHVRRRDNLAAAMHMAVEALFWFHPMVWWIGTRLIDERERACDEEVLRLGSDPWAYAESILKICEFYLASPLTCMSGITGSGLKGRIREIMGNRVGRELSWRRALLLAMAAIGTLAGPVILGALQMKPTAPSEPAVRLVFEVASVKDFKEPDAQGPRHFRWSYGPKGINFATSLPFMIAEAFDVPPGHLVLPDSLSREVLLGAFGDGYEIMASASGPVPKDKLRLMMQSLLADRFKLTVHRESRTGQVYRLVVAKGGQKLEESKAGGELLMTAGMDGFAFRNAEITRLCGYLSSHVDRMVIDDTGLKGLYNFVLKKPEDAGDSPVVKDQSSIDRPSAALFADALRQLGLRLIADKAPVEYLIVDHAERPTAN
jgi:uncharacterized protein (TIGR03435 family)